MNGSTFSHQLLFQNPTVALCFFAYAMSFISLWIRKTPWLWGSFFIIAYLLALTSGIAEWISLIPTAILFLCHFLLKGELPFGARFIFFGIAVLISCALILHFLPGFHPWQLVSNMHVSVGAYPYSLAYKFDTPLIGIFALALSIPLISSRTQLFKALKISVPLSILGIGIMMGISLYSGMIKWDPKIPIITFVWLIDNLIFVAIPEEAFFRGFVQRTLYQWFGNNHKAAWASIAITSLFFALLHLAWVANFGFICLVFIASVIYGVIYQSSKAIEGSILCHFGLNATHFFLFTYPALQSV